MADAKAVEMNEIYTACLSAGFDDQHAMQIVMWKLALEIQRAGGAA